MLCHFPLASMVSNEKFTAIQIESEGRSVVSYFLWPHELYSPWNSLGQMGVGSLSLLQGIFPTQGSNPGFPHCRRILYQLSHKGSPYFYFYKQTSTVQTHVVQGSVVLLFELNTYHWLIMSGIAFQTSWINISAYIGRCFGFIISIMKIAIKDKIY